MKKRFHAFDGRRAIPLLVLFTLTGCGPGKGDVTGKVTYQDKPIIFGSVQFIDRSGQPQVAKIGEDGSYSLQDLIAGDNRVLVHSPNPKEVVRRNKMGEPVEAPAVDPKRWFPIPEKYGDPQKSDLTFPIQSGKMNTINIDLK